MKRARYHLIAEAADVHDIKRILEHSRESELVASNGGSARIEKLEYSDRDFADDVLERHAKMVQEHANLIRYLAHSEMPKRLVPFGREECDE